MFDHNSPYLEKDAHNEETNDLFTFVNGLDGMVSAQAMYKLLLIYFRNEFLPVVKNELAEVKKAIDTTLKDVRTSEDEIAIEKAIRYLCHFQEESIIESILSDLFIDKDSPFYLPDNPTREDYKNLSSYVAPIPQNEKDQPDIFLLDREMNGYHAGIN